MSPWATQCLWAPNGKLRNQKYTIPLFRIFLYWSNRHISDWYRGHQLTTASCHFTSTGGHCPLEELYLSTLHEKCGVLAAGPKNLGIHMFRNLDSRKGPGPGSGKRKSYVFTKSLRSVNHNKLDLFPSIFSLKHWISETSSQLQLTGGMVLPNLSIFFPVISRHNNLDSKTCQLQASEHLINITTCLLCLHATTSAIPHCWRLNTWLDPRLSLLPS